MYSIFHIEGGIGKNILATAVVSSLKKSDPERQIMYSITAVPDANKKKKMILFFNI